MTIDSVKEIFKEMFIEKQNVLVNIVSENTTPLQRSHDKLTMEIKDNKDRLNNITKETDDLKLHCVKSVRIRSYSGPHFSRIFSHSD